LQEGYCGGSRILWVCFRSLEKSDFELMVNPEDIQQFWSLSAYGL